MHQPSRDSRISGKADKPTEAVALNDTGLSMHNRPPHEAARIAFSALVGQEALELISRRDVRDLIANHLTMTVKIAEQQVAGLEPNEFLRRMKLDMEEFVKTAASIDPSYKPLDDLDDESLRAYSTALSKLEKLEKFRESHTHSPETGFEHQRRKIEALRAGDADELLLFAQTTVDSTLASLKVDEAEVSLGKLAQLKSMIDLQKSLFPDEPDSEQLLIDNELRLLIAKRPCREITKMTLKLLENSDVLSDASDSKTRIELAKAARMEAVRAQFPTAAEYLSFYSQTLMDAHKGYLAGVAKILESGPLTAMVAPLFSGPHLDRFLTVMQALIQNQCLAEGSKIYGDIQG